MNKQIHKQISKYINKRVCMCVFLCMHNYARDLINMRVCYNLSQLSSMAIRHSLVTRIPHYGHSLVGCCYPLLRWRAVPRCKMPRFQRPPLLVSSLSTLNMSELAVSIIKKNILQYIESISSSKSLPIFCGFLWQVARYQPPPLPANDRGSPVRLKMQISSNMANMSSPTYGKCWKYITHFRTY